MNVILVSENMEEDEEDSDGKNEEDELDAFMSENNQNLNQENNEIATAELRQVELDIAELQQKLSLSNKDIHKMEQKIISSQKGHKTI